jgi:transposase
MKQTDEETKAQAVALVRTGMSRVQVAKQLGIPRANIGRWVQQADAEAIAQATGEQTESNLPSLHDRSLKWQERIIAKYDKALELALDRVIALTPKAKIREAIGAVSVIAEKRALATGSPTSIQGEQIVVPEGGSIEDVIAELDRLQAEVPAALASGGEQVGKNEGGDADGDADAAASRMAPGT